MEAHFQDWAGLLLRWTHLITGIAWIGASFYFNWLENRLQREHPPRGMSGDLWAVHGGGFYYLQKLDVAPQALPRELHWFKWEAYATWLTGFGLLGVVYYWNAAAFMLAPGSVLSASQAVALGLGSLLASWLVYDGLCRWLAGRHDRLLGISVIAWFTLLAWLLGEWLSGRAAYMHTGAAIGTVMVANVFRVIIPSQKDLVSAVAQGRAPDAEKGRKALLRSRHNNYLTLPVLFTMISVHYPGTYGHPRAWLLLLGIGLAGVSIRHYFNIRHRPGPALAWLAGGCVLLVVLALASAPRSVRGRPGAEAVSTPKAMDIVRQRCTACHSASPAFPGFASPPLGIVLESPADLRRHRDRVRLSVAAGTMPLGNVTRMTDAERDSIVDWSRQQE